MYFQNIRNNPRSRLYIHTTYLFYQLPFIYTNINKKSKNHKYYKKLTIFNNKIANLHFHDYLPFSNWIFY